MVQNSSLSRRTWTADSKLRKGTTISKEHITDKVGSPIYTSVRAFDIVICLSPTGGISLPLGGL
jgi:hypothetical protein